MREYIAVFWLEKEGGLEDGDIEGLEDGDTGGLEDGDTGGFGGWRYWRIGDIGGLEILEGPIILN